MFVNFRERGSRGKRETDRHTHIHRETGRETSMWERNNDRLPPACTPMGDQTHNLGMCLSWESNPQPFGMWDNTPTN